jgi:glycosyltransferase involved in cell wall biosynthesis
MNPRRILHVLDSADPAAGSAICGMVESLATGVDPARYRIDVCFLEQGRLVERLQRFGIKSTCVNWSTSPWNPWGAARYAALLRSADFSIIHQHTGGRFLTGMGRWLTRARIVRHLHFRASESTGIVPASCDLPERDALIAVSQIVADFSQDPRAVVVYPGIDGALFTETRRAHKGIVIGTACRLEPIKGLNYLIEALAAINSEFADVRLEIAGVGRLQSSLEQESRQLGISGLVSFIGWRDDLSSVMAGWDIFVLPSLDEGFPIAALEAMAAGLPLVASAVGGLCELVQDGKTGRLVRAAAPAELAMRLRELILDSRKRQAMGIAGRQRILHDFSVPQMVEQTTAVYDGLLTQ